MGAGSATATPIHAEPVHEVVADDARALRDLLLAEERRRLDAIEERLTAGEDERRDTVRRARAHSEVLVDSLRLTAERGDELAEVLRPNVMQGLRRSARDDPQVMADALYPVLGPAVRKLIASLFQPERSGSGRPYRIEQLFLIHRETSLVLAHSALDDRLANDAAVVSGMLDAIRSFVQDAFEAPDFDGMQTLTVGDITVWVEWGPQAVLAVVVRGFAPESLREACAETLRRLHLDHATALEAFDGDAEAFESLGPQLAASVAPAGGGLSAKPVGGRRFGAALLLLGVVSSAVWFAGSVSDERRWNRLLDRLDATPGIVVVDSTREGDHARLTALRDPLADAPERWMDGAAFAGLDVRTTWVPYLSLEPAMTLRRVGTAVAPGVGDGATLDGGVLALSDAVAPDRRATLSTRLSMLPGIDRVDFVSPNSPDTTLDGLDP